MKQILTLLIFSFCCNSFAWTSHNQPGKDYVFKFKMADQTLELKEQAISYEDAYEKAAKQCFQYFKGTAKVSENVGLSIIDVCANPRS
jgi:hypothetical protein